MQETMVEEFIRGCKADPKSEKCEEELTILIGAAIGHINSLREEQRRKGKGNVIYMPQEQTAPFSLSGAPLRDILILDREKAQAAKELVRGVLR